MTKTGKNLKLKETIWVNFLRTFSTGIVIMVFVFIAQPPDMPLLAPLTFPFSVPILFLGFLAVAQILRVFNLGGIGNIMCMFLSVPGDPLVYILYNVKPHLVPVKEFSFFNFYATILVYQDQIDGSENVGDSQITEECPFAGSIMADKEGSVMGFSWPSLETIFTIDRDWSVKRDGVNWGWIDKEGQIRKGFKDNPEATLSPGKIFGRIKHNSFFIDGEKYGRFIK